MSGLNRYTCFNCIRKYPDNVKDENFWKIFIPCNVCYLANKIKFEKGCNIHPNGNIEFDLNYILLSVVFINDGDNASCIGCLNFFKEEYIKDVCDDKWIIPEEGQCTMMKFKNSKYCANHSIKYNEFPDKQQENMII